MEKETTEILSRDNQEVSTERQENGMELAALDKEEMNARPKLTSPSPTRMSVRELAIVGLLAAIVVALGISGYGIINIPPLSATILHVPVLIGALVEGPKVGGFVGLVFGLYSLWQNVTTPNILSPLFYNPLVSVLPRVLFPIMAWFIFRVNPMKALMPRLIIAAFLGTILHTAMVMGLAYIFSVDILVEGLKASPETVGMATLVISLVHGIPEAILAGVLVPVVAIPLRLALGKDKKKVA